MCADSYFGVHSTPVLLQWHIKDPGHSAKSASGRLHLNTHTPLTQQSQSGLAMLLFRHSVGNPSRKELTCNLSENIQPQSCQLAEPLWTDPGLKSGSGVREPTSTSNNNNKKAQAGNEFSNLSVRSSRAREEKKTKKKKLIITLSTTEQNVRAAHSFSRRSGSFQPISPCLAIIISLHTQAFEG